MTAADLHRARAAYSASVASLSDCVRSMPACASDDLPTEAARIASIARAARNLAVDAESYATALDRAHEEDTR